MPSSVDIGKDLIRAWVQSRDDIQRILDFGPGMGTYRRLLGPGYDWTGIEVWEPYVGRYDLGALYNRILVGDLRTVEWPDADLLIFGDVLEHLPKEDAVAVIERSKAYPHLIVSIPLGEWPQGPWEGNTHEAHLSTWSFEELVTLLEPEAAIPLTFNFENRKAQIGIFIR